MAKVIHFRVTCSYCKRFQQARSDLRKLERISKTLVVSKRYCVFANEYVTAEQRACEHFEKSNKFWCVVMGAWMQMPCCLNRIRRKDKCVRECKWSGNQKKVILTMSRVGPISGLRRIENGDTKVGKRRKL